MYWIRHAKPDFGVHGQSRPLTKEAQQTTNENTNGILEQFSQKKTNLAQVNNEEINQTFCLIIHQPRKCLGKKTAWVTYPRSGILLW